MKKLIVLLIIILAAALPLTALGSSDNNTDEMRGVWISTAFSLDFPASPTTDSEKLMRETDEIINNCCELGFNTIILQVVPCGDALYKSSILPWSAFLTGSQGTAPDNDFDPLQYWVQKCHEKSISIHAWINPYRVTTASFTYDKVAETSPAKLNPRMTVLHTDGNYYYNPGLPETDAYILSIVDEIMTNYDVDGLQIDDFFYPGTDFPDTDTYNTYNMGRFSNIGDWRRDNVNSLVEQMYNKVHSIKSDAVFGVSPGGIWKNSSSDSLGSKTVGRETYTTVFADSYKWVKSGYVDYIAPQIYWEFGNTAADYKTVVDWWANVVRGTGVKLYPGLADYKCCGVSADSCWYNGAEIEKQMQYNNEKEGVSGEIHFRYNQLNSVENLKLIIGTQYHPNITVELNGIKVEFADQNPLIKDDRTLVPMRKIFEVLGYEVQWDESKREVTATQGTNVVWMKIDSKVFTSNGIRYTSDVAPCIIGDRTMIPLRALSESINCEVQWNKYQRKVSILK